MDSTVRTIRDRAKVCQALEGEWYLTFLFASCVTCSWDETSTLWVAEIKPNNYIKFFKVDKCCEQDLPGNSRSMQ
jgi:hypothetical protein